MQEAADAPAETALEPIAEKHGVTLRTGYHALALDPGKKPVKERLTGPVHFTVGFELATVADLGVHLSDPSRVIQPKAGGTPKAGTRSSCASSPASRRATAPGSRPPRGI